MRLSAAIAEKRTGDGLSQAKLGEMLGVTQSTISKWEDGFGPEDENLLAVANWLGISAAEAQRMRDSDGDDDLDVLAAQAHALIDQLIAEVRRRR